jgi:hypothetical protein
VHCGCVERAENEPRHNEVPHHANAFSSCILSKVLPLHSCIALCKFQRGSEKKNQATASFLDNLIKKMLHNLLLVTNKLILAFFQSNSRIVLESGTRWIVEFFCQFITVYHKELSKST